MSDPNLQDFSPADAADPADPAELCRCGAAPSPRHEGRCVAGHPLPGYGGALARRHGLHAATVPAAFAEVQGAFIAASITDDGGESEVATRRRSLHEYRGRLHLRILQLSDALDVHGLFDKRGRLRVAWLQRLEGLISQAKALDAQLGLERRQRPALTLEQAMRGDA